MPWDSSAVVTPVSVLNLWFLCTGTRADRTQGAKDLFEPQLGFQSC